MGGAPPNRSPSQGLNRSSHLLELPDSDPLPPHGSLPPGPPATDTRRNLPCSSDHLPFCPLPPPLPLLVPPVCSAPQWVCCMCQWPRVQVRGTGMCMGNGMGPCCHPPSGLPLRPGWSCGHLPPPTHFSPPPPPWRSGPGRGGSCSASHVSPALECQPFARLPVTRLRLTSSR